MRVAVIGVGNMGKHHARIYSRMKGVELVAICDQNEQVGKKIAKQYGARFYRSHTKLIKQANVDAVSIAVPTQYHKKLALDFIERKIHVLVEKPLADTTESAIEIVDNAKKNNVKLLVGHIERYNPATDKLLEFIKRKYFGELISITSCRVGLFPPKNMGVGVVTDLAVHDLDIITKMTGIQPEGVLAVGGSIFTKKHHDHAEILLDYGSFSGFIQVNWTTPVKIRRLSVTGTKGYAELNFISQTLNVYKRRFRIIEPKKYSDFLVKFGEPKKKSVRIFKKEPLYEEIKNFISSINGKSKLKVSGNEGIDVVKLSERVLHSMHGKSMI